MVNAYFDPSAELPEPGQPPTHLNHRWRRANYLVMHGGKARKQFAAAITRQACGHLRTPGRHSTSDRRPSCDTAAFSDVYAVVLFRARWHPSTLIGAGTTQRTGR